MNKIKKNLITVTAMITLQISNLYAKGISTMTEEEISDGLKSGVDLIINAIVGIGILAAVIVGSLSLIAFADAKKAGGDAEKTSVAKADVLKALALLIVAGIFHFGVRTLVYKLMGIA